VKLDINIYSRGEDDDDDALYTYLRAALLSLYDITAELWGV
jgi:hypothetical protein